ncbi:hypothetical protein MiSe_08620 [Microseira wollei NIES-4236]|uniref:Uncharacterized protein n=1 Tax=Microseira wollei NIES-4236 TaxID=2530354 RepID=A0AAV3WF07_9CYAN|nr:hypothetical protein MiSe_08620 [Microseira wollei NIES-4236]
MTLISAPSLTISCPVVIFKSPLFPALKLAAFKPLRSRLLGEVPLSSTDSEAFTVTVPALPLPKRVPATINAPSRRINRPVSIVTLPASPPPILKVPKPLPEFKLGELPLSSTNSEAFTATVPPLPSPKIVLASTCAPFWTINLPV